ncbi:hypothetical protein LTS08_008477 [Lithohypha guttulata]|uniref:uncharacterized protein n=1 Tax=Lithohypha guttulata TaxID=1690604 RepID=UPI002DDE7DBC|nr:hypothetical protein LTR51_008581 [Lithohypha guttulata]KAK5094621.1 hypothetical protein LTS08_008477 [Lithohypha guttulata]
MDTSSTSAERKVDDLSHVEQVHTNEKVPGHPNYYEKDGLRTYGDGEDHDVEPPMTVNRALSLVAMAFLWTGSQVPVYILGAVPPYIYADIGGVDRWVWFVLAYLLALAAICPFVGSVSDLIGRRWVSLIGSGLLVIAMIVCGVAKSMGVFIAGMTLSGIGAGICELTALAATSELAPTRKRGQYVAVLVFTIIPFCPSVLWAQLIAYHAGWRYCALLCGVWAAIGFIGVAVFYFPPARPNSRGLSRREVISEIDFVGGGLSITGMILFLAGLQWGGYQYPWTSAHVLAPLFIGAILLFVLFPIWEIKFAKFPMFPSRMKKEARILTLTLLITAISGANFFSVDFNNQYTFTNENFRFWPTQAFNVYGHDPIGVGIRGIPIGFSILVGACIVLWLLSALRGYNRELLVASSVIMTAGCGALAFADRDNLNQVWVILVVAGLGIGGIVVPASIITTIICPDDIIATVTALTLSIRVIGGCIGYTTYYNVFANKFVPNATKYIGGTMALRLGITNTTHITHAIEYTAASLLPLLNTIPGIAGNETAYAMVVQAGQVAYAESYKYVYYVSIAFGVISIIASAFLGNINKYMDDHVAVIIH